MINITTERCLIRDFVEQDLDAFMVYRNNEKWMQYQGFKGLSKEEYAERLLVDTSVEDGLQLAIISNKEKALIGDVYLKKEEEEFWIGYTVNPLYKRQGYASEVTEGVLKWIKKQGIKTIFAGVMSNNKASINLLEKVGFEYCETDEYGEEIYKIELL